MKIHDLKMSEPYIVYNNQLLKRVNSTVHTIHNTVVSVRKLVAVMVFTNLLFFGVLSILYCLSSTYILKSSVLERGVTRSSVQRLSSSSSIPQLDDTTRNNIESIITENKVVLFMKGNKASPQW